MQQRAVALRWMAIALLASLIPAGAASARTECEVTQVEQREQGFPPRMVPKVTCRVVTDPPPDASAQIKAVQDACNLLITAYGEKEGRRQCQELVRKVLTPQ